MRNEELDKLESEEFLNSLDQQGEPQEVLEPIGRSEPSWLPQDQAHYLYRAWATINKLYFERKAAIDDYNKVASPKTPKSVYSIKKSDVGRAIEQSANNIFYGRDKDSDAKKGIREYFDIRAYYEDTIVKTLLLAKTMDFGTLPRAYPVIFIRLSSGRFNGKI